MRLVDGQGRTIAQADPRLDDQDTRTLVLSRIRGKRSLPRYYCGRGLRDVRLNLDEVLLVGRLETHWRQSRRVWLVRLEGPGPAAAGNRCQKLDQADEGCGHPRVAVGASRAQRSAGVSDSDER